MKATIIKIEEMNIQSRNETVFDVHIEVKDGTKKVATKRLSLPIDSTEEQIQEAVQAFVNNTKLEAESGIKDKARREVAQSRVEVREKAKKISVEEKTTLKSNKK